MRKVALNLICILALNANASTYEECFHSRSEEIGQWKIADFTDKEKSELRSIALNASLYKQKYNPDNDIYFEHKSKSVLLCHPGDKDGCGTTTWLIEYVNGAFVSDGSFEWIFCEDLEFTHNKFRHERAASCAGQSLRASLANGYAILSQAFTRYACPC